MIPRIIPCLLLADGALVKTIKFNKRDYIGDPVNTINIFNRLEVDEVVLLDINATPQQKAISFDLIREVAAECTAPLTYGGGIRSVEDVQRILSIGVEKIVINTAAAHNEKLISEAAAKFGSQAIVVAVDVGKNLLGRYYPYCDGGRQRVASELLAYVSKIESLGAGEIFLNSIDRDGTMQGYDTKLIKSVVDSVAIPVIACGGAGTRADLLVPARDAGASAIAAGSLFVYQGIERGVLINFPTRKQIEDLFQ